MPFSQIRYEISGSPISDRLRRLSEGVRTFRNPVFALVGGFRSVGKRVFRLKEGFRTFRKAVFALVEGFRNAGKRVFRPRGGIGTAGRGFFPFRAVGKVCF